MDRLKHTQQTRQKQRSHSRVVIWQLNMQKFWRPLTKILSQYLGHRIGLITPVNFKKILTSVDCLVSHHEEQNL